MGEERRLCEQRIVEVANRLSSVRDRLVFIGGTVLPLLVDVDGRFYSPRMTDDVDAVGIAVNYTDANHVEEAVAEAGYTLDPASGHKGRWKGPGGAIFDLSFAGDFPGASGTRIDEMAIATARPMNGHPEIRHLSPTGLFLMKCAAYSDRGQDSPAESKDLADLAVLLVCADLTADVAHRSAEIREEVRTRAVWLAALPSTEVAFIGHFAERFPRPPETAEELAEEAMKVIGGLSL